MTSPRQLTRIVDIDGYPIADQWGRHEVFAFPAGTDLHTAPNTAGRKILPATDSRSGRDALIEHAATHPEDYLADEDAVRVELWMLPYGWNEGFDVTFDPMLTYFVAAGTDLTVVEDTVAGLAHFHPWTGFEVRVGRGSSQALLASAEKVAADIDQFIRGEATRYIP